MNKLKLEHLAPYLPYGLKVAFEGCDHEHTIYGLSIMSEGVQLISPFGDDGSAEIEKCIPILRKLDLQKSIVHKGIVINPMVELSKMIYGGFNEYKIDGNSIDIIDSCNYKNGEFYNISISDHLGYLSFKYAYFSKDNTEILHIQQPLKLISKLLEWHFDIFGLIDKCLAVDINTLKGGNNG